MTSIIAEKLAARSTPREQFSGVLRPGSVALVPKLRQNPAALALYGKLMDGVMRFKDVKAEFEKKHNERFPFFPTNTAYWNVHPTDLDGGREALNKLMALYGEVREGNDKPRLYRVPVVFSDAGGLERIFPSEFAMKGTKQPAYHSVETPDGRKCMYIRPVTEPAHNVIHIVGRKKHMIREEVTRGACDPSQCKEYAMAECKFFGTLKFHIPGMEGAHPYRMSSNSDYAAQEIWTSLSSIFEMFNGRLPKFDNRGEPVFFLTKVLKQRSYWAVDDAGKMVKKNIEQWVPYLETSIVMSKVLALQERGMPVLLASEQVVQGEDFQISPAQQVPAAWFASPKETTSVLTRHENVEHAVAGYEGADANGDFDHLGEDQGSGFHEPEVDARTSVSIKPPLVRPVSVQAAPEVEETENSLTPLQEVMNYAETRGLTAAVSEYGTLKYGKDWAQTANQAVLDDLTVLGAKRDGTTLALMLEFTCIAMSHHLDLKTVVVPYFTLKIGRGFTLNGDQLESAIESLNDLIENGDDVALAHMKQFTSVKLAA